MIFFLVEKIETGTGQVDRQTDRTVFALYFDFSKNWNAQLIESLFLIGKNQEV
jgi:hypothetical protein